MPQNEIQISCVTCIICICLMIMQFIVLFRLHLQQTNQSVATSYKPRLSLSSRPIRMSYRRSRVTYRLPIRHDDQLFNDQSAERMFRDMQLRMNLTPTDLYTTSAWSSPPIGRPCTNDNSSYVFQLKSRPLVATPTVIVTPPQVQLPLP